MASKNSVKEYIPNSYYHVYNRGVEKRNIFQDNQDYSVFLSYLQTYLSPKDDKLLNSIYFSDSSTPKEKDLARKELALKNYSDDIDLVCYSLLPNHFHLLLYQKQSCINHFMNSLGTRYSMYFNRKCKRTGVLFQDIYKAVSVSSQDQLLHLSRYIHLNPSRFSKTEHYPSSLPEFLNQRRTSWIKPHHVLDYFAKNNINSYASFMSGYIEEAPIYELMLDTD